MALTVLHLDRYLNERKLAGYVLEKLDCHIYGLDCLTYGLDCLIDGLDCLIYGLDFLMYS